MEVSCPSCGQKHDTDNYPGAVEIPCSCGYSVFVPDAAAQDLSPESLDPAEPFFNAPPLSFESQDDEIVRKTPEVAPAQKVDPLLSNNMTAPDDLPKEMPYDPYELGEDLLRNGAEESADPDSDAESASDRSRPRADGAPPPLSDVFQKQLLNRIQTASIGRFIGNSFNIQVMNLEDGKDLELLDLIEKFLKNQVWIREEIQRREIDLKKMLVERSFENIPESLAVEIYLRSFELGALCKFEKTDYEASEF